MFVLSTNWLDPVLLSQTGNIRRLDLARVGEGRIGWVGKKDEGFRIENVDLKGH
jgi:hypothetical protein